MCGDPICGLLPAQARPRMIQHLSSFFKCLPPILPRTNIMKLIVTCSSLHTQDPQYFTTAHSKMGLGSDHNLTTLRLLYYPPLPPDREIKPGQLRCGEHVDYGSITLLFREPGGGLQVLHGTAVHVCKVIMCSLISRWSAVMVEVTLMFPT